LRNDAKVKREADSVHTQRLGRFFRPPGGEASIFIAKNLRGSMQKAPVFRGLLRFLALPKFGQEVVFAHHGHAQLGGL
jgi:hypothetical protein